MKKLFLFLSLFFVISLQAQQVSWGTPTKLKESFTAATKLVSGKYLGKINGIDYYTYYSRLTKFLSVEGFQFVFCKVSDNGIQKFSPYTTLNYNFIDIMILNDQIAVIYTTGEKKEKRNVKIDYYNPNTFLKAKTVSLFSFNPIDKYEPFSRMVYSDDKSQMCMVINGKSESGGSSLIIKSYDKAMEELWTENYNYFGEGFPEIGDIVLSNSGKLIIHLNIYDSDKNKRKLVSYLFAEVSNGSIREINSTETSKKGLFDFKLKVVGEDQYFAASSEELMLTGFMLDFNKEEVNKVFTQSVYEGFWKIDDILILKNGNITIAAANRNLDVLTQTNGNGMTSYKYFYWNRSLLFVGYNPEKNEIEYSKYYGREFNIAQGMRSEQPQLTMAPFYFVKENDICVIYNTAHDTKDNVSNKKEAPFLMYMTCVNTKKPVTRLLIVDESGKIKVKTLFDAKTAKGIFATTFAHIDDEGEVVLAKFKAKYLTIGTVKL